MLRSLSIHLPIANSMAVLTRRLPHAAATTFLLGLLLVCTHPLFGSTADFSSTPLYENAPSQFQRSAEAALQAPQKAYDLLKRLEERQGTPLPGYVGGRDFQNRERRLPWGRYREYDVNPKLRGRGRDAERLVIERRTGKAYYTGDHYRTFVPLN